MRRRTRFDRFLSVGKPTFTSSSIYSTIHFSCYYYPVAKSCSTLFDSMDCSIPGSSVLHYLLEFAQIYVHWVNDTVSPSHLLPSIFPSIKVFPNESALHINWPKCWSFSCSISPFNEYSGLISFEIDWFALNAVKRTLKSLLQHHS